ncbi:MAG: hypothetical protein ACFE8G_06010 [Candidatus Hermodarchaeota archaeon]
MYYVHITQFQKKKNSDFYIYLEISRLLSEYLQEENNSNIILYRFTIMISSRLSDSEPILNLKDLFYDEQVKEERKAEINQLPEKSKRSNLKLLQEIQTVLQRCAHLTEKQRLMYCESQRYFMKQYLREMNKHP